MEAITKCRTCSELIGPARIWCSKCQKSRIDTALDIRFRCMTMPQHERLLAACDRALEATRRNNRRELVS